MKFSETLRKIRLERGLSQKRLAEMAGLSQAAIYQWEKGTREPKLQQLEKLASALNIPIDEFLGLSDDLFINHIESFITALYKNPSADLLNDDMFYDQEITEDYIISEMRKLNLDGQMRLLSHIEDLAKIPEYQNSDLKHYQSRRKKDPDSDQK